MDHRPISSFTGWGCCEMLELQKSGASPCVPCHSDRAVQSTPAPECQGRRQPSPAPSDLVPCAGRETGGEMDKHIYSWSLGTHYPKAIIQTFWRLYSHLHQWMYIHRWRWLYSNQNIWIIVKILGLVHTKWSWHINLAIQASTTAYVLWVTQCTMYKATVHVFVWLWAVM